MTQRPWYYYLVLQLMAACIGAIAVTLGTLMAFPPTGEPKSLYWRPATPAEEREYERKQLADLLEASRQYDNADR